MTSSNLQEHDATKLPPRPPPPITTYTVGYCSINSSQPVISPYTEDDGGPSTNVFNFFSNIKIVFQSVKTRGVLLELWGGSPVLRY